MTPELRAGDLLLRPLRPEDAPALHSLLNDWSVVRMLSRPPFPYSRELAEKWIASTLAEGTRGSAHHFVVTRDGRLLGAVGLTLAENRRSASLGYWTAPEHWGRGVTTRAARRVADWAFETLGLERLRATVAVDNPASAAVLAKLGFAQAGRSTQRFVSRGHDCEVTLHELTPDGRVPPEPALPEAVPPEPPPSGPEGRRLLVVVAAALIDGEGRVLLAKRPEGKPMAGLWEFPGGKVEPGETPEEALARELREELGLDLSGACLAPFSFVSERLTGAHLLMPLYIVRRWRGTPVPREGQELAWTRAGSLGAYPMPPADRPLVPLLRELLE